MQQVNLRRLSGENFYRYNYFLETSTDEYKNKVVEATDNMDTEALRRTGTRSSTTSF